MHLVFWSWQNRSIGREHPVANNNAHTKDESDKHRKLTLCMSKPIARFSPCPSLRVALRSFCCRQINASSSAFFTSNTYYSKERAKHSRMVVNGCHGESKIMAWKHTCGFWRKVFLLFMQPPARLRSGSSWCRQEPRSTASSHVLWKLKYDVLMRWHRIRSVKLMRKSSNVILLERRKKQLFTVIRYLWSECMFHMFRFFFKSLNYLKSTN